jgi:hypothetical protein
MDGDTIKLAASCRNVEREREGTKEVSQGSE